MIRHRSTAKRRGKTCHRRAVSDTCLIVECQHAEAAQYFVREVADFVPGRRRQHAGGQPAVDRLAVVGSFDEVGIAIFLHQPRYAVERVVPRDALPLVGARRAILGILQPARAVNEVDQARAFRTQRAAIDRMIRIALDVDDARLAFLAPSPRPYIRMPQATEQYGQVLRVSVVRDSLYWRTSAIAGSGAAPSNVRLELANVVPVTLKNCRRLRLTIASSGRLKRTLLQ